MPVFGEWRKRYVKGCISGFCGEKWRGVNFSTRREEFSGAADLLQHFDKGFNSGQSPAVNRAGAVGLQA